MCDMSMIAEIASILDSLRGDAVPNKRPFGEKRARIILQE